MRRTLFILALFVFSEACFSADLAIIFRPRPRPDEIWNFVRVRGDEGWPEVGRLMRRFGSKPFGQLTSSEEFELIKAVHSNPKSWGHVAIEFPEGYRPRSYGWVPAEQEDLEDLSRTISDPAPRAKKAVPAKFVDAHEWANDPNNPVPLQRIQVSGLTDEQVATVKREADAMSESATWKYQPTASPILPLEPDCANCATAVKRVFRTISDLDFIPDSGSITFMVSNINSVAPPPGRGSICNYLYYSFLNRLVVAY